MRDIWYNSMHSAAYAGSFLALVGGLASLYLAQDLTLNPSLRKKE